MALSREQMIVWFKNGQDNKNTHMLIVRGTFSGVREPVYAKGDKEFQALQMEYGDSLFKIEKMFDLRLDLEAQLNRKGNK